MKSGGAANHILINETCSAYGDSSLLGNSGRTNRYLYMVYIRQQDHSCVRLINLYIHLTSVYSSHSNFDEFIQRDTLSMDKKLP